MKRGGDRPSLTRAVLSYSRHDPLEQAAQLRNSRTGVGGKVVGGVFRNWHRAFGLIHRLFARRIMALLEVLQGAAKPEQLAPVR